MSYFDKDMLILAAVLLVFGIVALIKPDFGWKWRIGRWIDREAEPSESYILWSRIGAVVAIVAAVILFFASINTSR